LSSKTTSALTLSPSFLPTQQKDLVYDTTEQIDLDTVTLKESGMLVKLLSISLDPYMVRISSLTFSHHLFLTSYSCFSFSFAARKDEQAYQRQLHLVVQSRRHHVRLLSLVVALLARSLSDLESSPRYNFAVTEVLKSNDKTYPVGSKLYGIFKFQTYQVIEGPPRESLLSRLVSSSPACSRLSPCDSDSWRHRRRCWLIQDP
jgi:hypothetical protein